MKSSTVRFFAVLSVVLIAFCLAGCAKADPKLLSEKVTEMIDLSVARDTDARFSMLYPGVTDADTYRSTAEQIDNYFPVTAGYTLELQEWYFTKGLINENETYEGEYKVEFDGKVFYVAVTWYHDSAGEGFTRFRVVSEEELNAARNNGSMVIMKYYEKISFKFL
ncbi:MAG: hypothetical protein J6V01_00645 [Clostridia bacterium]|nr:hypothetical protein [Clostridia bacterium]